MALKERGFFFKAVLEGLVQVSKELHSLIPVALTLLLRLGLLSVDTHHSDLLLPKREDFDSLIQESFKPPSSRTTLQSSSLVFSRFKLDCVLICSNSWCKLFGSFLSLRLSRSPDRMGTTGGVLVLLVSFQNRAY